MKVPVLLSATALLSFGFCMNAESDKSKCEVVQQTPRADVLDARIPEVETHRHNEVEDGRDWKNPYVVVHPEGIELTSKQASIERRMFATGEFKHALIDLPLAAWPYGRVVAMQEASIRRGGERQQHDGQLIEENRKKAEEVLKTLRVKVVRYPS